MKHKQIQTPLGVLLRLRVYEPVFMPSDFRSYTVDYMITTLENAVRITCET